jgi:hypothetical protein
MTKFNYVLVSVGLILIFGTPTLYWVCGKWLTTNGEFSKSALSIVAYIFGSSWYKLPVDARKRTVVALLLFGNVITASVWQSNLIKTLNTNYDHFNEISTIDQLIFETNLTIMAYLDIPIEDLIGTPLESRIEIIDGELAHQVLDKIIHFRNLSFMSSALYSNLDLAKNEYLHQIWIVPEVYSHFYDSMIVPKTSPYIEAFNRIIRRYLESGHWEYHKMRKHNELYVDNIGRNVNGTLLIEDTGRKVIGLAAMIVSFYILGVLHLLSVLVLLVEIAIAAYCRPKVALIKCAAKRQQEVKDKYYRYFRKHWYDGHYK